VAAADVDGDGTTDLVVADGTRAVLFNGTGGGALTRTEYPATAWGTGLSAVAVGPMTAGDAVADAALGLSAGAVTPLTVSTAAVDKAPRLQPLAPLSGTEGSAVALTAAFADPDGGGPYTATIDWGAGSGPAVVAAPAGAGRRDVTATAATE